jgi:hypothetical protein
MHPNESKRPREKATLLSPRCTSCSFGLHGRTRLLAIYEIRCNTRIMLPAPSCQVGCGPDKKDAKFVSLVSELRTALGYTQALELGSCAKGVLFISCMLLKPPRFMS